MDERVSQPSLGEEVRQLRAIVAELSARAERQARIGEIMATASQPGPRAQAPRRRPRVPRDKRWLHVVRGAAIPAAAAGFVHRHARHAIIATAGAAVLAGGTLTPDLMQQAPAAQLPIVAHHRRHEAAHHRHREGDVIPSVAAVPRRRRRRLGDNDTATNAAAPPSPVPSPTATPDPDPSPTATPDPDPSPTATPDPDPSPTLPASPSPACSHPGKSCHGSDQVGDDVRALGGPSRLS